MSYTPEELKTIDAWNRLSDQPVSLVLVKPEDDPKIEDNLLEIEADFISISEQLTEKASRLTISPEEKEIQRPGLELADNILYSAYPAQKELAPFLKALDLKAGVELETKIPDLSEAIKAKLDEIDIPVHLKLYIALFCPHCPRMVEMLMPLAFYCHKIHLEIIDGSLFEQEAAKDKIMSAPCLVLDNSFKWTGVVEQEEVLDMIVNRDPANLSADTLKTIMEEGDAAWIANEMIRHGSIFDAFVQLLCHPVWSVRLGAMVIVEELVENDPDLACGLCPVLIQQFPNKDIPTQGDLLYALGEAGDTSTLNWIREQLDSFDHPDLKDAAQEAIETLIEKAAGPLED